MTRRHASVSRAPADSAPTADDELQLIVEKYRAVLKAAIRRAGPQSLGVPVADVEQEACIRLWQALRAERKITNTSSYLYRIGVSTAIDAIRRVRSRREEPLKEPGDDEAMHPAHLVSDARSPERLAADRQLGDALERAVAALDQNRQRAVRLHLQGFTSAEIAALLGWTEPKARNLVSRGMADLRGTLQRMGIGGAGD